MFTATVIGNLGADAEVKVYNDKKFVAFKVAHTDAWKGEDGVKHENTQWISCALNGDGGSLLPYLKKGVKVCVTGSLSLGVASSKIARRMVPTANLSVRDVELCGGSSDIVPRKLVGQDGVIYDTVKCFFVDVNREENKHLAGTIMYGERGGEYQVSDIGYITPIAPTAKEEQPAGEEQAPNDNANATSDEPF